MTQLLLKRIQGVYDDAQVLIGWFRGTTTGNLHIFHIAWENLWFPVDFPLSQPIEGVYVNRH